MNYIFRGISEQFQKEGFMKNLSLPKILVAFLALGLIFGGMYAAGRTAYPVLALLIIVAGMAFAAISVSGDRSEGIRGWQLVGLTATIAVLFISFIV